MKSGASSSPSHLSVVDEDLRNKIRENELLHKQVFYFFMLETF